MAIIDVYDALTSKRIYKPAYDFDYSIDLIRSECGKHFDPDIVTGFLEIEENVIEISRKFLQETDTVENTVMKRLTRVVILLILFWAGRLLLCPR